MSIINFHKIIFFYLGMGVGYRIVRKSLEGHRAKTKEGAEVSGTTDKENGRVTERIRKLPIDTADY
jgi:hypothetical protein